MTAAAAANCAASQLNPRSAGGGGEGVNIPSPLPYFLDSSNTIADINVKLSVPCLASILRLLLKFWIF